MSIVSNPPTDMIAPTTSSLRSGEREFHQETETGTGAEADFPFDADALLFPWEGVNALPLGLRADLEAEEGVLRGMNTKSIAQMVCFSFAALYAN